MRRGMWCLPAKDCNTQAKFFFILTGDCVTYPWGLSCLPAALPTLPGPCYKLPTCTMSCRFPPQKSSVAGAAASGNLLVPETRDSSSTCSCPGLVAALSPWFGGVPSCIHQSREDICSLSSHSLFWGQVSLSTRSCTVYF